MVGKIYKMDVVQWLTNTRTKIVFAMNEELTNPRTKSTPLQDHCLRSLYITGSNTCIQSTSLDALYYWLIFTQQSRFIINSDFLINYTNYVNIRHVS